MEYAVVGWPEEAPQLRLDYRKFSYAGKFVMSNTGKAVVRDSDAEVREEDDPDTISPEDSLDRDWIEDDRIVAAVAFNEDRTDPETAWLRYVTVRQDRRGAGLGARLARFATSELLERDYDRVRIAVNNPFAYHALYKAGFGFTGEETGLAELVLACPRERSSERYQTGLDVYRERDELAQEEQEFLSAKTGEGPPDVVPSPE